MADGPSAPPELPLFFNEPGATNIDIGVTAFECMGALPPHDHPHVYLNMGGDMKTLCPYCSTQYRFDPTLRRNETNPANCWATLA